MLAGAKDNIVQTLLYPSGFPSPLEIDDVVTRRWPKTSAAPATSPIATIPETMGCARRRSCAQGRHHRRLPLPTSCFTRLAPNVEIAAKARDGDAVAAKTPLMTIAGPARAVLSAERAALNFLGHLSGIATATAYVRKIGNAKTRICCTRKTTPGLRALEKYAIRCGGGFTASASTTRS